MLLIIEFIHQQSLTSCLFPATHSINSIIYGLSCKILYFYSNLDRLHVRWSVVCILHCVLSRGVAKPAEWYAPRKLLSASPSVKYETQISLAIRAVWNSDQPHHPCSLKYSIGIQKLKFFLSTGWTLHENALMQCWSEFALVICKFCFASAWQFCCF